MRTTLALGSAVMLAGCCLGGGGGGGSSSAPVSHRLDPYGISISLSAAHTGGATPTGYTFTSGDGSSTVQVTAAAPGVPAAQRSPTELLPGTVAEVQWSRPATFGGLPGVESRVLERSPAARAHWIGAVDGPRGVVWVHLFTDAHWVPGPTDGDLGWTTLRDSVRPAP